MIAYFPPKLKPVNALCGAMAYPPAGGDRNHERKRSPLKTQQKLNFRSYLV
ncbi:hypothetical protein [Nostoc sp.]